MCTTISFGKERRLYGRNLDVEGSYGERLLLIPGDSGKRAVIGIGVQSDRGPLLFDGMNDAGLYVCALNFKENGYLPPTRGEKSALHHDVLPYFLLSKCTSASEAVALLEGKRVVTYDEVSPARLHWFISDRERSFAAEPCPHGLNILDNPAEVLTNDPPLPYQLFGLRELAGLMPYSPTEKGETKPLGKGSGAIGLPGDLSSVSRFTRAYFLKQHLSAGGCQGLLNLLCALSVPKGAVVSDEGEQFTLYSAVADPDSFAYIYRTADSACAVRCDGKRLLKRSTGPLSLPLRTLPPTEEAP